MKQRRIEVTIRELDDNGNEVSVSKSVTPVTVDIDDRAAHAIAMALRGFAGLSGDGFCLNHALAVICGRCSDTAQSPFYLLADQWDEWMDTDAGVDFDDFVIIQRTAT